MDKRYENLKLKKGFNFIIGCDEVGRGCLAGPVVAAAVILDYTVPTIKFKGVADSKLLSAKQREEFDGVIKLNSLGWGIGAVSEKVIDRINIHQASLLAMKRAVENLFKRVPPETFNGLLKSLPLSLQVHPEQFNYFENSNYSVKCPSCNDSENKNKNILVVVDGKFIIPKFDMQQEAVVDGDAKILSIAAASIVAKVYRDSLMGKLHAKFPQYNFLRHKGYATLHHREAIKKFGLTSVHRLSFCSRYQ